MESWREVFRNGFVPVLPKKGLASLYKALQEDDERLKQGQTTDPPPLMCVQDHDNEGACMIGWCGWEGGDGLQTVGEVEEFFARACFEADQRLGEAAACRFLLNHFDDTPREQMRKDFLEELDLLVASGELVLEQ